jgi:Alginate export
MSFFVPPLALALCGFLLALTAAPARSVAQTRQTAANARQNAADSTTVAAHTPTPRPDYRNLRFDESWLRITGGDWADALKAMPIAPHLAITLGGQVRVREEFAHGFNLTPARDQFALSRTLVHADVQAGSATRVHGRVYVELRDAQAYGRDLPGGTRPSDGDRSDLQDLFADVGYGRSFVRYGRQEVAAGRDRLIGVPDWSNTRRGFQGARAVLVFRAVALDLLDARPVVVRQTAPNHADSTTRFRTAAIGSAAGFKPRTRLLPSTWQLYHYDQRIRAAAATHRTTTGARLVWTFGSTTKGGRSYGVETESAIQRGSVGARDIHAWFFISEVSAQWRGVRGAPTLAVGIEAASGDHSPTDATLESFNTLYALAHSNGGYADAFGRANARQVQLISTWDPSRHLSVRGALHHYDRLWREDGVYTKQNTILRAAGSSASMHAGDELDLTATAPVTRHLKVIAGHAWVEPGAFLRRSTGGAHSARWGFVGTTYTF